MKNLTAIVLTLNEEGFLPGCLKSLGWADEVIVVDAGSKDTTLAIAKKLGAKIVSAPWEGFPKQRNRGAEAASGEWLLYVDADERVSKALREEIGGLLKKPDLEHTSFKVPHRNIILGRWLKHGGWYPEYQHRLLNKSALKGWIGELHEHPEVEGSVGTLKGDLVHLTHRGMQWMLAKTIRYTRLEAELRKKAGHPQVKVRHLMSAPAREFWYRCVKQGGWKDGVVGWIEILYQMFNHFLIMAWLWEMQRGKSMADTYRELDGKINTSDGVTP